MYKQNTAHSKGRYRLGKSNLLLEWFSTTWIQHMSNSQVLRNKQLASSTERKLPTEQEWSLPECHPPAAWGRTSMFGFLLYNKNMAPLVNFKLTSVTLTQINTKPAQLISSRAPAYKKPQTNKLTGNSMNMLSTVCPCVCVKICVSAQLLTQVCGCMFCLLFFPIAQKEMLIIGLQVA